MIPTADLERYHLFDWTAWGIPWLKAMVISFLVIVVDLLITIPVSLKAKARNHGIVATLLLGIAGLMLYDYFRYLCIL